MNATQQRIDLAAQCLQALLSSPKWVNGADRAAHKQKIPFKEFVAAEAFIMADTMLRSYPVVAPVMPEHELKWTREGKRSIRIKLTINGVETQDMLVTL